MIDFLLVMMQLVNDCFPESIRIAPDQLEQLKNPHFALHFTVVAVVVDEIVQRLSGTRPRLSVFLGQHPTARVRSARIGANSFAGTILIVDELYKQGYAT